MADKLMYIHNDDTQSYSFCRLQLVVETFVHSTKKTNQHKFIKCAQSCIAYKYENNKTLGTSIINSTMSLSSLPNFPCQPLTPQLEGGTVYRVILIIQFFSTC